MRWWLAIPALVLALPAYAGEWSLHLRHWHAAGIELPGEPPDDVERQALGIAWHRHHGRGRTGVSYLGQPLLIRAGNPGTNGYLHRVDLEHAGRLGAAGVDAALGVHGSSNIFTHAKFRSEALTGRFDLLYPVPGPLDAVGLAGDYRFGGFHLYPRVTATVPAGNGELALDLPVGVHWRDPGGRWALGVERYGDKWATLDTTETVEGKTYLSEWQLTGRWRFGPFAGMSVEIGAGLSFDTEVEYLDLDRGRVRERVDPAPFAFLTLRR